MQPRVSIIVPVFNAEKYIHKCIDSILSQTLKDIEVILINDGSEDESKEILDQYGAIDSRVKVIHQKNSGPSVARNKGIKAATGKYIGFVDSDDYIESTMYEKLFSVADENNVQVAMCNYREVDLYENSEKKSNHKLDSNVIYTKKDIEKSIISTFTKSENYGFYSLCNKIYNRGWLLGTNVSMDVEREHGEDWWFNIQMFMNLESFVCVNEALYNYIHVNKNSLMGKYRENQFELCLDGRIKLKNVLPEELVDYRELNTRFIYEFSSYLLQTVKYVKDKNKCIKLITKVVNNKEVKLCCVEPNYLSNKYKIILYLLDNGYTSTLRSLYLVVSLIA